MMKKNSNFYFGALAATAILAACATDDGLTDGNYDEQRGVVKTEFSISYPVRATQTRMTSNIVQTDASMFRGITGIKLYPFTEAKATVEGTSTTALPTPITLTYNSVGTGKVGYSSSTVANQIDASGMLYTTNNSHLYKDVEIPIGTLTFMFYGKAIPGSATSFEKGMLNEVSTAGGSGKLEDIQFNLQPITSDNTVTASGNAVATYLSGIAAVPGWSSTKNVVLSTLYNNFVSMTAGSYTNMKAAVKQLYTSLFNKTFSNSDDQALATSIMSKITATNGLGTGKTVTVTTSGDPATITGFTFPDLDNGGYPADKGLPDGAAVLSWSGNTATMVTTGNNMGMDVSDLTKYVYPAELYYRGISEIKVADVSMASAYADNKAWSDIIGTTGFTTGAIARTTRSVAIIDPVQYAVGRLDVKLLATNNALPDATTGTNAQTFDASSSSTLFKMTGVLIGGQKPVNYLFQPTGTDEYTIYDKTMNHENYLTTTVTTDENANHTLVLETAAEAEVKIAVEFEYSASADKPIVGTSGLIYPGTKFYLCGSLKPEASSGTKTFQQDYYTVATLKVSSLKSAYNYLPDLRAPQLELGLSVDLVWQAGYTQNINIE